MDNFNAVFKDYSPMIYHKAIRMLGKREDALDVLQEVAVKIHTNFAKFQEMEHKIAWIYRITTNVCLNVLRAQKYRPSDGEAVLLQLESPTDVESEYEKVEQIRGLLQMLPFKLHSTFIYYFIDGMTQEEIAEVTESARITVARTLKKISSILKTKDTSL